MNNHEVELRVLLKEEQAKNIMDKIKQSGAIFKSKEKLIDVYFCSKDAKSFADVEMNEVGSNSIRLRQTTREDNVQTFFNIKIITTYGDHHSWEEHETKIDSLGEMKTMLKAIGQKDFIRIEKERTNFIFGDMLIIAEDIKDFGLGLEIEIMTTKDKTEEAKEKIKKYLSSIGIAEDKIVPKSITNIIMREKSRF